MDKKTMLESVKYYLSKFGKIGKKERMIISAIDKIDRKLFVLKELENEAYQDNALSIEKGQTISQPSTVARMLQLLNLKKGQKVLEIGTGSGWNACLIAFIIKPGKIITTEFFKELAKKAKEKIKKLNFNNIRVICSDFKKIKEKFDRIIFTAGIIKNQETLIENFAKTNLKEKGILVCPFQSGPLIILKKINGKITKSYTSEEYIFVPLINSLN